MKHNTQIVINRMWLSNPLKPMGIIKTKDIHTNDINIYIGIIKGEDEEEDIKRIIDWGTKLSPEILKEYVL